MLNEDKKNLQYVGINYLLIATSNITITDCNSFIKLLISLNVNISHHLIKKIDMRKLIIQEWLSIDGYAADEKGSTDFFGSVEMSADSDQDILERMNSIDTILLGANTYKLFVDFWPTPQAEKEIIANRLNETPKIIFSNSLEKVEWGKWNNASLQGGNAIEEIKKLKQLSGGNIVLWGSLSLTRSLLSANLIDEIQIRTVPIILGKGLRLFGKSEQIKFETTAIKQYDSGITLVEYKLKPQA